MNSDTGGQSPAERQRQTAAEIARKKVLAAYSSDATRQATQGATRQAASHASTQANFAAGSEQGAYKQSPAQAVNPNDWQKYHSAWQKYYQNYYSDYYAKAASQYIATEQLKKDRAARDQARAEAETKAEAPVTPTAITSTPNAAEVERTLKDRIQQKANEKFRTRRRHRHFVPLLAGALTVLFILFLQFNRVIFAPIMAYVAPGNTEDTGITALDPTITTAPGPDPKLIIPKLNIDVPVAFGISNDDATVMEAMNHGVAHFAIPGANALPGQIGNLVITGHSAGDIYSANQYKFIFSGLERLVEGDLIYVNYESVRYTYSVVGKQTVEPTDVAALVYDTDKPMLTLITCTPLGTSRYRLLVSAEQINPAPSATSDRPNTNESEVTTDATLMPSNEPSLLEKFWNWLTGQD